MDTKDLIADLRRRISPAHAMWPGTESYERRECVEALEAQAAEIERLRERLDRALTVCRCALRVIESSAYQGVSDEDCDLETSTLNWQMAEKRRKRNDAR